VSKGWKWIIEPVDVDISNRAPDAPQLAVA
jgi:hypothetical protein